MNSNILDSICGSNPATWFICNELSKEPIGEWVPLSPNLAGSNYRKARARERLAWLGVAEFRHGWLNWVYGRLTDRLVQIFRIETIYHCRRGDRVVGKLVALPDNAPPDTIGQMLKRKIDRVEKIGDFCLWELFI